MKQILIALVALADSLAGKSAAAPGYGEPISLTTGVVRRVGTVTALQNAVAAVNAAGVPATILVSNGTYVLTDWALPVTCDGVIIRSLGGDRDAVVIRGPDEGASASLQHVFWVTASHVTIADLTFGWCLYHGIQAHGETPYNVSHLWVHNCRIVNCNEQFIKGTSIDGDPEGVTDGLVENCLFEFTSGWAYQFYTGGIDAHKAANWTVRDNLFRNIRATDGLAEHAIHFWKRNTARPQNVAVERNVIVNCDRGIGFGLGGWADGHDGGTSVIRNNVVYNDGAGPNTDVGIGLESATGVKADNNTVVVPYWAPIEFRFAGSSNLVFRNNLAGGAITARDGAPAPARSNNLESVQAEWFRSLTNGDLRLKPGVTGVLDKGCAIAAFADDVDGDARPAGAAWDIGADEYDPWTADSNFDGVPDGWYLQHGLNPTSLTVAVEDEDEDEYDNKEEWIALTDPTNGASFFRVAGIGQVSPFTVTLSCSTARVYTLEQAAPPATGDWSRVPGAIHVSGAAHGTLALADTNPAPRRLYRVSVGLP
ncbi:MAG TPA: right-handed parallel beta-helix repeat-containing protein [Kiritimatiellia bacterium]|nr:right-handed parallel beta-helix repeat-containing protein [Kiritimatiellia bacterium]HRZ10830.1 right-handed parallel beta-helix repeat-containing protein [Kiritimatiellia bacterium]HSA18897.1 right-handed parallel beta-helix repeat-containing protein [Kiritimatiellia bacterium]